jgi:transcription elongation factor GreA
MSDIIYITRPGYEGLKTKLEQLRVESDELKDEISILRGDDKDSENTLYQESVARQTKLDQDIISVKNKLNSAKVIDPKTDYTDEIKQKVRFGAIVRVINIENKVKTVFQIVGVDEIDLNGDVKKISYESPMGKEMLNKKVGDPVEIITRSDNDLEYEILEISY